MERVKLGPIADGDEDGSSTLACVYDGVESDLVRAEAEFARGAFPEAICRLRSAWREYVQLRDVLAVYAGDDRLGDRCVLRSSHRPVRRPRSSTLSDSITPRA